MIQRAMCQSVCIGLIAGSSCLFSGCDDAARGVLRGAVENIGASMVERSSDDGLRKLFERTNAACPVKMDAYTTLERVDRIDETHIEYHYLVSEEGRRMASRFDQRAMKEAAVKHMKGNAMAIAVAERDLTIHHIYEDRSGNHVLSFMINKAVLDGDLEPVGSERNNPFGVNTVKSNSTQSVSPSRRRGNGRPKSNPAGVQDNPYF